MEAGAQEHHTAVVARYLTNDCVTAALSSDASLVLTGRSSRFCHAANALRFLRETGRPIRWLVVDRLVSAPAAPRVAGVRACPRADGAWDVTPVDADGPAVAVPPAAYHGLGDRGFVMMTSGVRGMVAMSGRSYDPLTVGIISAGLRDGTRWPAGVESDVYVTADGRVLIAGHRFATQVMTDSLLYDDDSLARLERLETEYRALFDEWVGARSSWATIDRLVHAATMLRRFYGLLLVLHESYSPALETILGPGGSGSVGDAAVPGILRWQLDGPGLFRAKKDFLEPGGELPVPPASIDADMRATRARVLASAHRLDDTRVELVVRISVLKEWKFFIAKALMSHFSRLVRSLAGVRMTDDLTHTRWRQSPLPELIESLRRTTECGSAAR